MVYTQLLDEARAQGLIVREKNIIGNKGRIKNNRIAIRKVLTTIEKKCILAEELGHHYTSVGDITMQTKNEHYNRKQERQARLYSYNKLIGLNGIIQAFEHGCKGRSEIAEYLEITEEYLNDAIECYRNKYGVYTTCDNYIIYFIPSLMVGKMIWHSKKRKGYENGYI